MQLETTEKVPIKRLRLDQRNPRLLGTAENSSDVAIIAHLYRAAELDELLQSISANGYLDIEPLVVMPEPDSDNLIVLEGNRRLAALRVLREPDLVRRIASFEQLRTTVPPIYASLRATLDHVWVYPVISREQARTFIGFKHINGPAKWDAYAKARFAAEWYKSGRSDGVSLTDIAQAIGDRHDTIKRMVSAIYVLEQAESEGLFDIDDRHTRKFNFSHLYTALTRSQYMEYLGLETAWARHDPEPNQVPRKSLKRFGRCSFGSTARSRTIRGQPCGRRIPTSSVSGKCPRIPKASVCSKRQTISTRPTQVPSPWTGSSPPI